MRSVLGLVGRFLWRSLPSSGGVKPRFGPKLIRKLDLGTQATVGKPGQIISRTAEDGLVGGQLQAGLSNVGSGGFSSLRSATHRLFVNNVLRRVTNSQSYQLRRRAADQLVLGNSVPFLALVGVSLASGSGLITKEDELECVVREVRLASKKAQLKEVNQNLSEEGLDLVDVPLNKESLNNGDLEFGPAIAKGCNAVVYSARWRKTNPVTLNQATDTSQSPPLSETNPVTLNQATDTSQSPPINETNPDTLDQTTTGASQSQSVNETNPIAFNSTTVGTEASAAAESRFAKVSSSSIETRLQSSSSESVLTSSESSGRQARSEINTDVKNIEPEVSLRKNIKTEEEFPLAVKMMFNYDIESNAYSILKAMQREMVVAQSMFLPDETSNLLENRTKALPQHPNIVRMVAAFADSVPSLSDSINLYPAALPKRLHSSGFGRNMSLFLVMKRYDGCLRSFLHQHADQLSWRTSLVLLTQLLEGVSHMVKHGVCHRDLKTDNLLVDKSGGFEFPLLAIADFGCCLADKQLGLKVPFGSHEIDRGGNAALMAPEIATAEPGLFTNLNYAQADVWAAGTIAYEIFGAKNPFYDDASKKRHLDTRTYSTSDLPSLPTGVPSVLTALVHKMLDRQPGKRISAELAGTVCQLFLWAPRSWIDPNSPSYPNTQDILQWMLTMTTKVLYESKFSNGQKAHREYQLVSTFLSRVTLRDTKLALAWIRQNNLENPAKNGSAG